MKAQSRFLLICALVACLTVKCVVGVPLPQDEGDDEDEEAVEETEAPEEETPPAEAAAPEADDAAAVAAAATPTGALPEGLSNILESSGPGESVARADPPAEAAEDGEVVETSEADGEGGGEEDGFLGALGALQEGLKENAPHVAVGGIGVAAVACVVGFSSKIISMLKGAQLPDISTIGEELKKQLEGGKPGESGPGSGSNGNGHDDGTKDGTEGDGKSKDPVENAKEKLKSKMPWNRAAVPADAGAAAGGAGAGAGAAASGKASGFKDMMSKKALGDNESGPLAKGKSFLRKKDEIRQALKDKVEAAKSAAAAAGVGSGAGAKSGSGAKNKLGGIAEDDEGQEDLIGVKSVASNESGPPPPPGAAQPSQAQADQLAKIGSITENPELLKELQSIVKNPEDLEKLGEILKHPIELEEIRKLVDKPEQLRLLESMSEDPSSLRKLERSIEASDKFAEIDSVLGKAKGMLGSLEQKSSSLYSGTESQARSDVLDSRGAAAGGYQGKTEASIRRLDDILAKYNDEGLYADGAQGGAAAAAARQSDDYLLYGSTSGGDSPGDTLTRGSDYQRIGGGDSRGSTMTRSAISPYDAAYYDNSNQIRMVGEESLEDIQRPAEFDILDDEGLEDPRLRQPRVAGRPGARIAGGAVAGGGAAALSRARGSPTVLGRVGPAQSAAAAARRLPQPTARTAATRAIAGGYARSASPLASGASRIARPVKTLSAQQVMHREREDVEYDNNGRRVQFRPDYADQYDDDYLYQQQTI